MAGAKITVAMAMTMNPAPCEPPVSFCEGPLKSWMSCWKGAYITATRIWPPRPMAIPTRSMTRKRSPRSRDEVARALVPAGQPRRADEADPQAEQGGHHVPLGWDGRRGDGGHLRGRLPGDGAGDVAEDQGADLADQEADDGVDEPHPGLALGLRGDPRGIEEGDVALGHHGGRGGQLRERRVVGRRGRQRRGGGPGCGGGRGRPLRRARRRRHHHGRPGRRLLEPLAGHVPVRNRPGRACGGRGGPAAAPPGSVSVIDKDVTGARTAHYLQGDPYPGDRRGGNH